MRQPVASKRPWPRRKRRSPVDGKEGLIFVLTRQPGESIVIGESAALTVSVVGREFADVLVRTAESPHGRLVTLSVGQREQLVSEVFVVLFGRIGGRAKLGIEAPRTVAVERIDA